ncbi:MAG: polysaccharide deacetylase family protein [Solirubrobacterales bacterium]
MQRPASDRPRLPLAGAVLVACLLAGLGSADPGLAERSRIEDPADAAGPLDLASAKLRQSKRALILDLHTRGPIKLGALRGHPSRAQALGEPVLCLRIDARGDGRWILCGAGSRDKLGVSKVSRAGAIRRAGAILAQIKRRGDDRLEVRFSPGSIGLRPGTLRWSLLSDWRGAECRRPPSGRRDRKHRRRQTESACFDRAPDHHAGAKFRLLEVRAVGCSMGPHSFARSGITAGKRVALTFDDGPGPYTGALLRTLRALNVKATFFVIGRQAIGQGSLLRAIHRQGSELANHSLNHEVTASSASLARTNQIIRAATGFLPCRFRAPGDSINSALVSRARGAGMTSVGWNVDPQDWRTPGTGAIQSRVVSAVQPGSIVVLHDGGGNRSQTVAAVPGIIRELHARGYTFATVTEILGEHRITALVR